MNTQLKSQVHVQILPPTQKSKIATREELWLMRRQLVILIEEGHAEIGGLTVARHRACDANPALLASAHRTLLRSLNRNSDRVRDVRDSLIEKLVATRLSQLTECRFQMMVDGVPFYYFIDQETGTKVEHLAYGTEANRVLYQLKADLEKTVRRNAACELVWVDETLANWARQAAKAGPQSARRAS